MEKDDRYTRITLRIPKDLHSKLSDAADETSKSMNAEIIARLESTFPRTDTPPIPPRLAKTLADIDGAIDSTRLAEIEQAYDGLRDRLLRAVDEAIAEAFDPTDKQ
ncbi:Arc family DNA-binding protein [Stutzerimonas xanthomarina]|uniref:Arc family DNA-binding protein n=1 Tax=Stutzerimonas xanthomarina TaxID=271420 RepID=UPI003AA8BC32